MTDQKKVAQEIVSLMSYAGPFPGLWTGKPMTADQVISYIQSHKCLPMQNGHTKNSLEMRNTRNKISRRVAQLMK